MKRLQVFHPTVIRKNREESNSNAAMVVLGVKLCCLDCTALSSEERMLCRLIDGVDT